MGIYGGRSYYKTVLYRWFYGRFSVYVRTKRMDKLKSGTYVHSNSLQVAHYIFFQAGCRI